MFKVGDRIKCTEQRQFCFPRVGEFYNIVRFDRIGDIAIKDKGGYCSDCTYPQGMFIKVFEVGDTVKCLDTFYIRQCETFFSPGKIFIVKKVTIQGNKQYLYPDENSEINCDEFDVELVEEAKMFNVGDRIEVIWVSHRWVWPKVGEKYEIVNISPFGVQLKRESDSSISKCHYYIGNDIRVKLIKEDRMFKIGDRVAWCGHTGTIVKIEDNGATTTLWDKDSAFNGVDTCRDLSLWKQFKKIEEATMSKYQELKERIENLQNGWDKEADDILSILQKEYKFAYIIRITGHNISANGEIRIEEYFTADGGWKKVYVSFKYSNQCSKLGAFKSALLWLLDHSDIKKDEKEEKIKALRKQMEEIQNQIINMELIRR